MGYVNDTHMHFWLPPALGHYVTGTWSDAAGQVANTIVKKKAAAAETGVITFNIALPANDGPSKGCYIQSLDVFYEILTAEPTSLVPVIYLATLPADDAAFAAPASQAFTYDTNHNTAANRYHIDQHKMTLTITTPVWIEEDQVLTLQISSACAAGTVFDMIGVRVNYTYRL